jgi:probable rRNA maturation factor
MSLEDDRVIFRRAGREVDRHAVRGFAATLRSVVAGGIPFTVLITDDRELRRLNRQFLGHEYPTDVLSFPSASSGELGDIAISVDRAAAQAVEFGHKVNDEVGILMLHGVLHLLGLDHERDKGVMKRAEKKWRHQLGLPTGLLERSVR